MRRLGRFSLFFTWLWVLSAQAQEHKITQGVTRYIVIIGENRAAPGSGLEPLQFADDDAARFAEILHADAHRLWLLTRFDPPSMTRFPHLIQNAITPTRESVLKVFNELKELISLAHRDKKHTELILILIGHGHSEGAGPMSHIMLADDSLTRADLIEHLPQSKYHFNHIFIDACEAASMIAERGSAAAAFSALYEKKLNNTGWFVSTSKSGKVPELDYLQSGVFSFIVRSGLTGVADINGDGHISYSEMSDFVALSKIGVQTDNAPKALAIPPNHDKSQSLFGLNPTERFTIHFPRRSSGRYQIWDERDLLFAEFSITPNWERTIYLPQVASGHRFSEYQLFLMQGERTRSLKINAEISGASLVDLELKPTLKRLRGDAKLFETGLFAVPFGPQTLHLAHHDAVMEQLDRNIANREISSTLIAVATLIAPAAVNDVDGFQGIVDMSIRHSKLGFFIAPVMRIGDQFNMDQKDFSRLTLSGRLGLALRLTSIFGLELSTSLGNQWLVSTSPWKGASMDALALNMEAHSRFTFFLFNRLQGILQIGYEHTLGQDVQINLGIKHENHGYPVIGVGLGWIL